MEKMNVDYRDVLYDINKFIKEMADHTLNKII